MLMKTVLSARNIDKYFYKPVKFHVLKDINFHLKTGEFMSIMGKSGSGKSTLLYILSTMDTDYEGALYLQEELISGKPKDYLARLRNTHIGFVFQFHYLLGEFSVLDNVMLPALKLGLKSPEEIRQDAREKLKMLHIEKLAEKRASRISGGEKQRVAIARSLINCSRKPDFPCLSLPMMKILPVGPTVSWNWKTEKLSVEMSSAL